ncbi:MAG: GFA family protein [Mesorhizobium sp.]|nr:MAG: GFA family protein [Mesorhizobium sp.]
MPETIIRRGGCLCGAVRYTVRDEPFQSGLCHCGDCRKVTGTSFLSFADWRPDQFESSGEVRTYDGRSFCPVCGSRVFNVSPHQVEIYLGTLDDAPNAIRPAAEIWVKRREPWLHQLDIPQFMEDKT